MHDGGRGLEVPEGPGKFDRDVEGALSLIPIQSVRVEDKEVSGRDSADQASSSVLTSVIKELRRVNKFVNTTLPGIVERSIQGVYANHGKAPPTVSEHPVSEALRVLEREGLGG